VIVMNSDMAAECRHACSLAIDISEDLPGYYEQKKEQMDVNQCRNCSAAAMRESFWRKHACFAGS
jgi:hypothetical protein